MTQYTPISSYARLPKPLAAEPGGGVPVDKRIDHFDVELGEITTSPPDKLFTHFTKVIPRTAMCAPLISQWVDG